MRKTGDKCGFTQVYASLIAALFMTASSASFLPVIAGVIVGRTLGWTAKRPQQHLVSGFVVQKSNCVMTDMPIVVVVLSH